MLTGEGKRMIKQ